MTNNARYKLLDEIEEEYTIFMEKLDGLDNECFDIAMDDLKKTPKEILEEQIDLMTECITQKEVYRHKDDVDYTYEELKYIFNLMHMNLMSWVESLSDDSRVIEEYENGNYATIIEWFDRYLIGEFKIHNEEISLWREKFMNQKGNL